jgi:hypothetical protein
MLPIVDGDSVAARSFIAETESKYHMVKLLRELGNRAL